MRRKRNENKMRVLNYGLEVNPKIIKILYNSPAASVMPTVSCRSRAAKPVAKSGSVEKMMPA